MTALRITSPRPSRDLIDHAIARHGAGRVLLAALLALLRPKARPPDAASLPDHLRRDVGLPDIEAQRHWTRYLR
ncbi:hypothetical protein MWU52_17495 [Jannaschia sp. S6380]|uniref:hypothetical protein n=1 Tax=Jannaschia sp. S6380 TaxID=2926408 RepID=UPI001FF46FF0|nr:hypothetical protein [Jannaschia sp. S6380]MCK0169352.1 hypothetical protein [Jannaschia sp. S6380]